jgi:hypothetical protein
MQFPAVATDGDAGMMGIFDELTRGSLEYVGQLEVGAVCLVLLA